MLSGGKRVAYTRVQVAHVIYSQVDWEKGRNAGKVQSVFLRVGIVIKENQISYCSIDFSHKKSMMLCKSLKPVPIL